jgi:coenzyme F420-0:L-glutamate ligase / coenzyme F420-1:gamma-L-glutamate ligase
LRDAVQVIPLLGLPKVEKGDDISKLVLDALSRNKLKLEDRDVVVITQKVVSKSQGRVLRIDSIKPSKKAVELAPRVNKDPRVVEAILRESKRIVREGHEVIITETSHGFVCANSGVDLSNVPDGSLALLPLDPDGDAAAIRERLENATGKELAIIISDTFGRPWREGQVDVAIGCSGIEPLETLIGRRDPYGYELKVTEPAIVDEIAAASELVMRKLAMVPVSVVRGVSYKRGDRGVRSIIMKPEDDLFR